MLTWESFHRRQKLGSHSKLAKLVVHVSGYNAATNFTAKELPSGSVQR